ncbi:hypothetical protein JTE90_008482 [Oedothorax gibbosus]|uniref:Uncharacterized protein n=1 Tax=Oedothorax gibbosus TaxID=931172 RepID=A0AAV6V0Y4_9ARAC|nr:hypothetical protein JTE90_008482 [Oedothorax gibbosus]
MSGSEDIQFVSQPLIQPELIDLTDDGEERMDHTNDCGTEEQMVHIDCIDLTEDEPSNEKLDLVLNKCRNDSSSTQADVFLVDYKYDFPTPLLEYIDWEMLRETIPLIKRLLSNSKVLVDRDSNINLQGKNPPTDEIKEASPLSITDEEPLNTLKRMWGEVSGSCNTEEIAGSSHSAELEVTMPDQSSDKNIQPEVELEERNEVKKIQKNPIFGNPHQDYQFSQILKFVNEHPMPERMTARNQAHMQPAAALMEERNEVKKIQKNPIYENSYQGYQFAQILKFVNEHPMPERMTARNQAHMQPTAALVEERNEVKKIQKNAIYENSYQGYQFSQILKVGSEHPMPERMTAPKHATESAKIPHSPSTNYNSKRINSETIHGSTKEIEIAKNTVLPGISCMDPRRKTVPIGASRRQTEVNVPPSKASTSNSLKNTRRVHFSIKETNAKKNSSQPTKKIDLKTYKLLKNSRLLDPRPKASSEPENSRLLDPRPKACSESEVSAPPSNIPVISSRRKSPRKVIHATQNVASTQNIGNPTSVYSDAVVASNVSNCPQPCPNVIVENNVQPSHAHISYPIPSYGSNEQLLASNYCVQYPVVQQYYQGHVTVMNQTLPSGSSQFGQQG